MNPKPPQRREHMAFVTGKPFRQLTVLAQDPSVVHANGEPLTTRLTVPNEAFAKGPSGHRFRVVDYDASTNRFRASAIEYPVETDDLSEHDPFGERKRGKGKVKTLLKNADFHAQNVFAIASHTLMRFEAALGRRVNWGCESGSHYIKIAPHAFADANAFYSRRDEALMFGYFPAHNGKDFIYTCLSFDIVAHETTHAILDGLRAEYFRPSSPDQAAFHEGFADIVALLLGLGSAPLLDYAITRTIERKRSIPATKLTPDALRKTVVFGLADEVGGELTYDAARHMRGDALRRSVNIPPSSVTYPKLSAQGEAHDLGELLVAVVMTAFLEVWRERMKALYPGGLFDVQGATADRERVVEEGTKAAQHLLRIVIRAIDYMPPVNASFPDFLTAILTADQEAVPHDERYRYRELLRDAFATYGIEASKPKRRKGRHFGEAAGPGMWTRPPDGLVYGFSGFAEMTWDRESVFRFVWENRNVLDLDENAFTKVCSVRPAIRVGPDGFTLRETVAEYLQVIDLYASELHSLGVEVPEGMGPYERVELYGGGTLIFDDYGRLKYHIGSGVRSTAQSMRLKSRWERGEFDKTTNQLRRFERLHRARSFRDSSRTVEKW